MRDFFRTDVMWQLNNGDKVNAISQPWFQGWGVQEEATRGDRQLKVSALVDSENGQWNVQELARLFQPNQVQEIITDLIIPSAEQGEVDRLVWKVTKCGKYTVKEGYNKLVEIQSAMQDAPPVDWHCIWQWKKVPPKVKIFIWRLLHKGLPVAVNMHNRIDRFPPICQRCQEENEYEMHCFFFCNTSRQVWFAGSLGIRVHDLPLDIIETVTQIVSQLDEEGVRIFFTTMWEIWKERNKQVMEHTPFVPHQVLKRVNAELRQELYDVQIDEGDGRDIAVERHDIYQQGWQVIVDGSWEVSGKAGGAYVFNDRGKTHSIGLHSFCVQDAFQAEAWTLNEAIMYTLRQEGCTPGRKIQFFSDCMGLVLAVNQNDVTDLPSWRATTVTNQIIRQIEESQAEVTLHFARREAVKQAHNLANLARRSAINYQGVPHMALQQQGKIGTGIDESFFQMVQERPP
ncbi:hypothetical protein LUZ63_003663 [Rhynchospora breviuscula]|uniref:Reverse transcriptase zinc-binding domain-containing protein n=1 Tax=Rhynchospora breviuscula TaxID=2022672 RepID=A0A9Q0D143_9POAL|nr:hypothetical protein LUZ63_003663 [Rhynchospora breviuscula]